MPPKRHCELFFCHIYLYLNTTISSAWISSEFMVQISWNLSVFCSTDAYLLLSFWYNNCRRFFCIMPSIQIWYVHFVFNTNDKLKHANPVILTHNRYASVIRDLSECADGSNRIFNKIRQFKSEVKESYLRIQVQII